MCALHSLRRGVAQLVERLVWDQEVAGSSPVAPTIQKTRLNNVFFVILYTLIDKTVIF